MSTYKRTKRQRRAQAKRRPQSPRPTAADFHRHLDRCHQCESQPFNLCATGRRIMAES